MFMTERDFKIASDLKSKLERAQHELSTFLKKVDSIKDYGYGSKKVIIHSGNSRESEINLNISIADASSFIAKERNRLEHNLKEAKKEFENFKCL